MSYDYPMPGNGVSSINSMIGAVTLTAGTGITIAPPAGLSSQIIITGTGGTATSVGLALPVSVFTVSGSPVTSSGTLTGSFASQSANLVFASPNGAPGVPAFRALVAADLPAGFSPSATQTTLSGSAGTAVFSQPFSGASYKKVVVFLTGFTDTGTQIYTYPTAFTNTPYVYGATGSVAGCTASTTTVRFTTTTQSGFVFLEGY